MSLAWSLIPHVTQHDLADITELEAFRKQQDTQSTRLTVTAFALKAAAVALQQFPQFNSSLDMAAGQLIQKRYLSHRRGGRYGPRTFGAGISRRGQKERSRSGSGA